MTHLTRRGLLGGAAGGALVLGACTTHEKAEIYDGSVDFQHGVASGDPLSDRVILWTRVTPLDDGAAAPIPVEWEIVNYYDATGRFKLTGVTTADPAKDWCVKIDAAGLEPGIDYAFVFRVRTPGGVITSPQGRTKTTAISGGGPVQLGVVSCSNWQFGHFTAYTALSKENGLDAIVHLGDYIYEYGIDGYGGDVAKQIGRPHDPIIETVTLTDYRLRHAQYKTDPGLQDAHAAAPWICTWDDHESTNDSYRTGAQNHNPEDGEGDWTMRKQVALQAYFEWMPIREPGAEGVTSAVWRSFKFGDVASLHALETRLTGRSPSLSWFEALEGATRTDDIQARAAATMAAAANPERTMMGAQQEEWLAGELSTYAQTHPWQVLANQTIMARTVLPNMMDVLSPAQRSAQDNPFVTRMVEFSALGLPMNLDAWDGYPAARDRLYAAAKSAGANLVTLTGDTHTAWANHLLDKTGDLRGVEFGCTSISSPGMGSAVKDVPELGQLISDANEDVQWFDPFGNGYMVVTLTAERVEARYEKVSTVLTTEFDQETAAVFSAQLSDGGLSNLEQV